MVGFKIDRRQLIIGGAVLAAGCSGAAEGDSVGADSAGEDAAAEEFAVTAFDDRLAGIVAEDAIATVIASGFTWVEGPTWDQKRDMLYFSDIPPNRVHSWDAESGLGLWRAEAGSIPAPEGVSPGTNGLLYLPEEDALLVCDQSSRSIIRYDLASGSDPVPVARGPEDRPFNSPNDLVMDAEGGIFFTDPSYGLAEGIDSPVRARDFNGVYYVPPGGGEIVLIDDGLTFPNGIGLSPDGNHLYVAISDPDEGRVVRYSRSGADWVRDAETWHDMEPFRANETPGNPDGMAIATDGTIFATAPGGMNILSPEGELLGRLVTGRATGNCCFGEDGKTLFITSNDIVVRLPVLVSGLGFAA